MRTAVAPGWDRSISIARALPSSATSASRRSLRRAARTSRRPLLESCRANSTPRPAEAPVISATPAISGRRPDLGLLDLARTGRRLTLGKGVDMLHAALDLAPDGVLIVEEARVVEADEELAVRAVGVLSAGHRADAADVRLTTEFRLQVRKVGAAGAAARRVAALGHEAGDHAMKRNAVVEAALRQLLDPLDMARGQVRAKLDDDFAAVRKIEDKAFIGHRFAPDE